MAKKNIEAGTQFDYWTVLRQANEQECKNLSKRNGTRYLCRCVCGKQKTVSSAILRKGQSTNCGCKKYSKLAQSRKDLTGMKVGKLTVLEYLGPATQTRNTNTTGAIWKCKCECGTTCYIRARNLITENTISCGCIASKGQYLIREWFNKNNIDFIPQYTLADLYSSKGYRLFFDFAIIKNNKIFLLEYNGR